MGEIARGTRISIQGSVKAVTPIINLLNHNNRTLSRTTTTTAVVVTTTTMTRKRKPVAMRRTSRRRYPLCQVICLFYWNCINTKQTQPTQHLLLLLKLLVQRRRQWNMFVCLCYGVRFCKRMPNLLLRDNPLYCIK